MNIWRHSKNYFSTAVTVQNDKALQQNDGAKGVFSKL